MKTIKIFLLSLSLAPILLNAKTYYCKDSGSTELDMFGTEKENIASTRPYHWIVDTNRGWKRSDVVAYSGSCGIDNGYTVCRADTAYGEAFFQFTLTIPILF